MPEIFSLGPLMIQSRLLILIVSFILTFFVIRRKVSRLDIPEQSAKQMLDRFVNAVILAVLVWKFTPVLWDPSIIWTDPLKLLSYTGGTLGILLGVLAGIIYLAIVYRKSLMEIPLALDLLSFGMLISWTIYRLVFWEYGLLTDMPWGISLTDSQYHYHPINIYAGIIGCAIAVYVIYARNSRWGTGTIARDIWILLGFGWFIVTFLQRGEAILLLTADQWLLLAMIGVGLALPYMLRLIQTAPSEHTNDGKEMTHMVKETSMNSSLEQRKQAQENREEQREYKSAGAPVDKKLDGPNRPAE